jgi:CubicO group peptidase (beta-lactamase class C family)
VTPETVFMIASVSKLFAGAAVLKLVPQGIIDLDDNIYDVLPDEYEVCSCINPLWSDTPVT